MVIRIVFLWLTLTFWVGAQEPTTFEMHTAMMHSAVKISGPNSTGSGFLLWRPSKDDPKRGCFILFTANHVLAAIKGDTSTIVHRVKDDKGLWARVETVFQIRDGVKDLWFKNAVVDVAALPINEVPKGFLSQYASLDLLVDEDTLKSEQFHPGDEIFCLGYPMGYEANKLGFPFLRSGRIASYPLLPTSEHKILLFDGRLFPGNSGGPAYFTYDSRAIRPTVKMAKRQGIIGLVLNDLQHVESTIQTFEKRETVTPLSYSGVVQATFLKQLVDSIPVEKKNK